MLPCCECVIAHPSVHPFLRNYTCNVFAAAGLKECLNHICHCATNDAFTCGLHPHEPRKRPERSQNHHAARLPQCALSSDQIAFLFYTEITVSVIAVNGNSCSVLTVTNPFFCVSFLLFPFLPLFHVRAFWSFHLQFAAKPFPSSRRIRLRFRFG